VFLPGDLRWRAENEQKVHEFVKMWCARCGWKSDGWIARPDWVHKFDQRSLEHFFWSDYPLTAEQKHFLQTVKMVKMTTKEPASGGSKFTVFSTAIY
jgi:hypothetical protein